MTDTEPDDVDDDQVVDELEPGVLAFPNELARRVAKAVGSSTHRPRHGGPSPS